MKYRLLVFIICYLITFGPAGKDVAQVDYPVGGIVLRNVRGFSLPKADPTTQRLRRALLAKTTFGVVVLRNAVRFVDSVARHGGGVFNTAVGASAPGEGGDAKTSHTPPRSTRCLKKD